MYNHVPENYVCPFCLIVRGIENEHVLTKQADLVYQDEAVTAFVGSDQWPKNQGHVLIIPNEHYENIYDLPLHLGARIHQVSRTVAVAMKSAYDCDGTSTRQHNEPAGNQEVWHYHLHVFPRYPGDELYRTDKAPMVPELRAAYAARLRKHLAHR